MDSEQNVVCFGGPLDGKPFDYTADPPFGYKTCHINVDGERRKFFLYQRIKRSALNDTILREAVRRVNSYE